MSIPFTLPSQFANPLLYDRIGALIKDRATGQIVGHLQETVRWGLLARMPIPGGNPLELVTEAIQVAQLAKIQQTLNTVQTLATVGAVASVASLGVSIAGFALVLSKLKRMDGKLDQALSKITKVRSLVDRLHIKVDALPMARLRAELEAVGLAQGYDRSRRTDSLQRSIAELATLRHYYAALLMDEEFCSLGTDHLLALTDTHERLVAASEGELFAEFLLNSDPHVISQRWQRQQETLQNVCWKSPGELFDMVREGDRARGVELVIDHTTRAARIKSVIQIRTESIDRLGSLPELSSRLAENDISSFDYLCAVEEQAGQDEPLLVADLRSQ